MMGVHVSSSDLTVRSRFASSAVGARLLTAALSSVFALGAAGCEPELGGECAPDRVFVKETVRQELGKNNLAQNVNFENCGQRYCLSIDASRPFCTKRCQRDLDCDAPGFTCQPVIEFGIFACEDWDPQTDCLDENGNPSERPIKYCTTTAAAIADRDEQFGRTPEDIPADWGCPANYYQANDGCDCGCGVVDPDCGNDETDASCRFQWCGDGAAPDADNNAACVSTDDG
jgi:hypothetical protein